MTSRAVQYGWPIASGQAAGFTPIAPSFGMILATLDGSTGQTYSLTGAATGWTNPRLYRATLGNQPSYTQISSWSGGNYVAQAADEGYRLVVVGTDANGKQVAAQSLHVVAPPPILLEGFESTTGFTATANATLSVESGGQVQGSGRLIVQANGTANAGFDKTNIGTFDPATFDVIAQMIDVGFDPAYTATSALRLNFTRAGISYPTGANYPLNPLFQTPQPLFYGKMWGSMHVSEFGTLSTIGSGQLGISQTLGTSSASNAWTGVGVDALLARAGGRPTLIIGFDDNFETQYSIALPYMRDRAVKGGIHLVSNYIDQGGRLSTAMINEMYAADWDVYLNTTNDGPLTSKTTVQGALDDLAAVRAIAQAKGWTRGNEFFCYPNGSYQNSPTRPLTSFTSNGTNVITVASATNIGVGMTLAAGGVPSNTTVSAVNGTSITVSNNVPPFTNRPCNFVDLTSEFSYTKLPLALKAAGYKMGRTTQQRGSFPTRFGIGDRGGILTPGNGVSNLTLDQVKAMLDTAVLRGETLEIYMHAITDTGSINTSPAKFMGIMDYAVSLRDQGKVDILTKTELWLRDGNAGVPAL